MEAGGLNIGKLLELELGCLGFHLLEPLEKCGQLFKRMRKKHGCFHGSLGLVASLKQLDLVVEYVGGAHAGLEVARGTAISCVLRDIDELVFEQAWVALVGVMQAYLLGDALQPV